MKRIVVVLWMLQPGPVILENEYVKVTKNLAPCAAANTPNCSERVVVALAPVELRTAGKLKRLDRGGIAVFRAAESYDPPVGGDFLEVALKPNQPPAKTPSLLIAPEKNTLLYDGRRFLVFEEKLLPGETRARHSHSERVVIILNKTRLQQWPDGAAEVLREQVPNDVRFNPPVIHVVKNVGDQPLRNIVIEFKP